MKLETKRLILRPWTEDDVEDLYTYAKDPQVGPIAGWPAHKSLEDSRNVLENVFSQNENYAVCLKEDNRAIGCIGFIKPEGSHTAIEEDDLEIGYWLGVPFWGKGIMPEAVRKLQELAFLEYHVHALWCGFYDGNEKSHRCQEKCGFIYHHTEGEKTCELMGDIRTEHYTRITKEEWMAYSASGEGILYVHGKGGNAAEAEHYKALFPECGVHGFDYRSENPWDAKLEFEEKVKSLRTQYQSLTLVANSIGAFFSMNAALDKWCDRAYFISPIANMESLIMSMLFWEKVTEARLQEKKTIPTSFGEDLSWEYLTYVRKHPISWKIPTKILYGSMDTLQTREVIDAFSKKCNAELTVLEGGEHWFHTKEQMAFLDAWITGGTGGRF